jgi:hypothetical protein
MIWFHVSMKFLKAPECFAKATSHSSIGLWRNMFEFRDEHCGASFDHHRFNWAHYDS